MSSRSPHVSAHMMGHRNGSGIMPGDGWQRSFADCFPLPTASVSTVLKIVFSASIHRVCSGSFGARRRERCPLNWDDGSLLMLPGLSTGGHLASAISA